MTLCLYSGLNNVSNAPETVTPLILSQC